MSRGDSLNRAIAAAVRYNQECEFNPGNGRVGDTCHPAIFPFDISLSSVEIRVLPRANVAQCHARRTTRE